MLPLTCIKRKMVLKTKFCSIFLGVAVLHRFAFNSPGGLGCNRSKAVVLLLLTLFIVTPIVGVCNWSTFCCTLLYVHSSIAIILMEKRELVALLNLSSWCLVMVERLFLAMPRGCLRFVIVVFPDHTHLLILLYTLLYTGYP